MPTPLKVRPPLRKLRKRNEMDFVEKTLLIPMFLVSFVVGVLVFINSYFELINILL